ncbi:hypothetical protein [Bernardetia sp.]|uniref:hypothetical protein n=1 Tax=Bernardetia sp. TaxID=1937974 RepID=UPI0025C142FD|nr:hypothetical protein [Bernardetia sp.]
MRNFYLLLLFLNISFYTKAQFTNIELLQINDSIPISMGMNKIKLYADIDSIVSVPSIMDASTADSLIYIGESYLAYYEEGNEGFDNLEESFCEFEVIVFDDKIKSITLDGKNKITSQTTFEQIQRLFPSSCKDPSEISIYGDDTKYTTCSVVLITSKGIQLDMQLIFYFANNKLKRVDFWHPI